jgi:hypothetical protein
VRFVASNELPEPHGPTVNRRARTGERESSMVHGFLPQGTNPITMVRQSGKRMRTPDILEVHELVALFDQLSHRDFEQSYRVSERHACCVLELARATYRYEGHQEQWIELRMRIREIAQTRVCYALEEHGFKAQVMPRKTMGSVVVAKGEQLRFSLEEPSKRITVPPSGKTSLNSSGFEFEPRL